MAGSSTRVAGIATGLVLTFAAAVGLAEATLAPPATQVVTVPAGAVTGITDSPDSPETVEAPDTVAGIAVRRGKLRRQLQRDMEVEVLALTNEERRANGCSPLRHNSKLRKAARKHTVAMARADEMSHQLPGEAKFSVRITRAGYTDWRLVAENVARGFLAPEHVMAAWMASPSHRHNIVNCRLKDLGVGVVSFNGRLWWTQDFGVR